MSFTYCSYQSMIESLKKNGYTITNYKEYINVERCVILRHDVDYDMSKAVEFAKFEKEVGIKATYMILVTSDFYNIFSRETIDYVTQIIEMGHDIGLHFDEKRYLTNNIDMSDKIYEEVRLLRKAIGYQNIKTVSMHRPSKDCIKKDIINGNDKIINTYNEIFLKDFKYVSDSRMHWREPIMDYIESSRYNRLHILTHPFWYEEQEEEIGLKLERFINRAKRDRTRNLQNNFTNLEEYIKERG